ncbi:hypothetical protein V8C42DRAFT_356319 [Trichoderma barbatum]
MARLRRCIKSGRLIVSTNALGLGVDMGEVGSGVNEVGSVRLVVHAGMPKLWDFVQESGRAGRDGARSQSIVICREAGEMRKMRKGEEGGGSSAQEGKWDRRKDVKQGKGKKDEEGDGEGWEEAAVEFVEGIRCRREVLGRVMDGRFRGSGCEADEEASAESSAEEEAVREEARIGGDNFERRRRQARFTAWQASEGQMKAVSEAEEFRQQLGRWAGRCVVCSLGGEWEVEHEMEACPGRSGDEWQRAQGFGGLVEREIFEKKRLGNYSGFYGGAGKRRVNNKERVVYGCFKSID